MFAVVGNMDLIQNDEEAIVAKLLNEFIVDEATAKSETTNFLKMLAENGLLRDDAIL